MQFSSSELLPQEEALLLQLMQAYKTDEDNESERPRPNQMVSAPYKIMVAKLKCKLMKKESQARMAREEKQFKLHKKEMQLRIQILELQISRLPN